MRSTNPSFDRIKPVLEFVWNNKYSSFYREKYKKVGINLLKDVNSLEDFSKLPFLTREELVNSDPMERIFIPMEKIDRAVISSGTTNSTNPLIMPATLLHPQQSKASFRKFKELKIKRVMQLGSPFTSFSSSACFYRHNVPDYWNTDGKLFLIGDLGNLVVSARIIKLMKIEALRISPTALYNLMPYLIQECDVSQIKLICLIGEFCSEQKMKYFKEFFKHAYFDPIFGGSETGGIFGYRCDQLAKKAPRLFHLLPVFHYEILKDAQNELVLTNLFTETAFPLIRYKSGNAAEETKNLCKCGRKITEMFGRIGYDVAHFNGLKLYADHIASSLSSLTDYLASPDYQFHIYEEVAHGTILYRLKIELIPKKNDGISDQELADILKNQISSNLYLSATKTMAELVKQEVLLPLEIKFVEEFLPRLKQTPIILHFI